MNRDKREPEYPVELESQFILRLPEEPAKVLRDVLKSGENLKNRLTIQVDNEMRNGEVRFDHWLMHAKILDLPTIIESLKTIDTKSFYKTADICQIMICKEEADQPVEEESPTKTKKKDPYKVDKKFLYPHGVTPPTKNVRKRRFRKTLKKKYVEAPEIEKEVKRLLRADNEAVSVTWEVIKEDDDRKAEPSTPKPKPERKKAERAPKKEVVNPKQETSNVVDIFGGAVSDSDAEDDNINVEMEESRLSPYSRLSDNSTLLGVEQKSYPVQFESQMFSKQKHVPPSHMDYSEDDEYSRDKDNMTFRIQQLKVELDELKQRRQRTQNEISGMDNQALRQRFQDTLHTLNQDIMYKEMEYQGLITLQNSEDI
ncbi:transcription initiation factor TFIID subunit 7-like [Zerene cesonia]|uniref:transcription initiation factor TFIID subunit 7-like n=1 Tax=Zerene cesonia TaxID=33412 RepID=UPI0018E4E2F3|nr:transcription initiation factor TFIID subunit 7-like [Zerene cesonia]